MKKLNKDIGFLFFAYHGLVQKQELILFPSAMEIIEYEEFRQMHIQSFDYGFAFIKIPDKPSISLSTIINTEVDISNSNTIKMQTGTLSVEQLEAMINTLPVDVTFINADDKVAFFSRPTERVFPRSVAIIGRDVRQCHPPESVHMVEQILQDFKKQKKDKEIFWLQIKDMFILIQYFAVRNSKEEYIGTLEVSQEVSDIRELSGEKRIL